MDAQAWDERYRGSDQLFSGLPNGVLVTEAADLPPGRALDVGCGEGADVAWLARRGWQVTGIDISQVALERAAAATADVAGEVTLTRVDLATMSAPSGPFDLVSAQYFPLPVQPDDHAALRGLLAAVVPGGTLLFVGHDLADLPPQHERDFDPSEFYHPSDIADLL
ncbi:MAG: class I SAM-dependent methyltransferase, partial [Stackebrandtia sp.]